VRELAKPARQSKSRSSILTTEHFTVEPCRTCHIPGYLVLTPRHTVESLSQMNSAALASLGPTLAMVTAAIEAVVRPQRVYCALFSEETRAVHFHLFPRTKWLTARYFAADPDKTEVCGPRLMDWARRTFQKPITRMDRDETLEKIRVWLKATLGRVRTSKAPEK
jgi:diadenosine tetraphosphate (Ap4A) HIT family hydrolase